MAEYKNLSGSPEDQAAALRMTHEDKTAILIGFHKGGQAILLGQEDDRIVLTSPDMTRKLAAELNRICDLWEILEKLPSREELEGDDTPSD